MHPARLNPSAQRASRCRGYPETQKSLRELNGHASRIEDFARPVHTLAVTGHALEKARQEAEALATQFKNTERPTRVRAKVLESAKRAAEDLQAKYNRLTDSVNASSGTGCCGN